MTGAAKPAPKRSFRERMIDELEDEASFGETPAVRKAAREELREIAREENERERWENEGDRRGWR